jgi:hypothetical protein
MAEASTARTEDALMPRPAPTAPNFMVREPAAREVGHMCDEDRRRFVHIALDSARERLRAYRLVCIAAQGFYLQRCGCDAEAREPKRD